MNSATLKPHRNAAFLAFVREHQCVCGMAPPSQAAHVRIGNGGGMGVKPSDYRCVPLCPWCHQKQHNKGERTFWLNAGRDPDELCGSLLVSWLCKKGAGKEMLAALEQLAESIR